MKNTNTHCYYTILIIIKFQVLLAIKYNIKQLDDTVHNIGQYDFEYSLSILHNNIDTSSILNIKKKLTRNIVNIYEFCTIS